jgi:Flp pilus assembly protein protease CpaA
VAQISDVTNRKVSHRVVIEGIFPSVGMVSVEGQKHGQYLWHGQRSPG